jgi:dTDP-4-dehydrorhamnose reductase
MRVLILGGSGMLGHKLWQHCADRFDTYATFREPPSSAIFDPERAIAGVDAGDLGSIRGALERARPDWVVNCIGIVKQDPAARDPLVSLGVNSMLPHQVAAMCASAGARLIHLSTDCVFSGERGGYRENDFPDAHDLYGRTKLLGELSEAEHCLTIRTSLIGRELSGSQGLMEWFLSRAGTRVHGYRHAIFSGFATPAMARLVGDLIAQRTPLHGLYHVAADPISKYELLSLLNEAFQCGVEIVPDDAFHCDRSLDGSRFTAATGFRSPSWQAMIAEMRNDPTPYSALRGAAHP